MTTISLPNNQMKSSYKVVVIGTGYGGGIAASRMSRAGQSVCVLERGKEIRPGDYPNTLPDAVEQIQTDFPHKHLGSNTALFDFRINEGMSALVGCGLGGTSLINANVALEAKPAVFSDPRWPEELRSPGALEAAQRRALEMLEPTPYPDDMPPPAKLTALETSAGAIPGAKFARTPIYVTFQDPPGGVNKVGVPQQSCNLCGNCVTGCNYSAKNTVLMNYLPDAKNHGAEIFTEISVRRISREGTKWVVHYYINGSREHQLLAEERTVTADIVIVAAGTLGSTEILLRSKQAGLPLSNMVGQHFSANGDLLGFAYNGKDSVHGIGSQPPAEQATGPCITGYIDTRSDSALTGSVVEDAAIPGALSTGLSELFALAALSGENTAPQDWPEQSIRTLESLHGAYHRGATQNTQTLLAMGYDDGKGVLQLTNDRLRISWEDVGEQPVFEEESNTFVAATRPHHGIYIKEPIWNKWLHDSLVTVHPLGGCVMAPSAELGVVDHKGRVFADTQGAEVHEGLYVSDGSVIPMPLGVNPSLTIAAVAERCCELIAEDHGWIIDYRFD